MERSLQNILLEEKGESLTYIPINGGGGEPNFPTRASRKEVGGQAVLGRQAL